MDAGQKRETRKSLQTCCTRSSHRATERTAWVGPPDWGEAELCRPLCCGFWEKEQVVTRELFVSAGDPVASDDNDGSAARLLLQTSEGKVSRGYLFAEICMQRNPRRMIPGAQVSLHVPCWSLASPGLPGLQLLPSPAIHLGSILSPVTILMEAGRTKWAPVPPFPLDLIRACSWDFVRPGCGCQDNPQASVSAYIRPLWLHPRS